MQCACAVLYCLLFASLPVPYVTTLPQQLHNFRQKVIEDEMCVLIFCTTWKYFLTIRGTELGSTGMLISP